MSQLLKKFALLTACTALALCFTTRSAHAQAVMMVDGGVGEHLFFAYWSTENYTDTHVNITSPLGNPGGTIEEQNVVYIRVRSAEADRNTVRSFNICLTPGDSWTARLTSEDGLTVVDAGNCDSALMALGTNPGNMNSPMPPMEGESVSLGAAGSGYLEAWLNPSNVIQDDKGTANPNNPDPDFSPDHATPRPISGTATLVSPMSGFASSYNAVALTGCGVTAGIAIAPTVPDTSPTHYDDGNGCWAIGTGNPITVGGTAGTSPLEGTANGAWITQALRGAVGDDTAAMLAASAGTNDMLVGRWTALSNDDVMSHTKIVLTFPAPNHLNLTDGTSDPVSIHVYDDMGGSPMTFSADLPMGVNMCRFMQMDMKPTLSCNGNRVGALDSMSGTFRIFNNLAANATTDRTRELPGSDVEAAPLHSLIPAESLGAIGLVFSYFEGSDGNLYDQVTSPQSIDATVDNDGNSNIIPFDTTPGA